MSATREAKSRLRCGPRILDLTEPRVMGVLNLTPDSFSDGGRFLTDRGAVDVPAVIAGAEAMVAAGAAILDVGGESTRPGAGPVSAGEELRRVMPVVERLAELDTIVSIDTGKAEVARVAVAAGAKLVNDVTGLGDPEMLTTVAAGDAALCLMHMRGEPRTMQDAPAYRDVVVEVTSHLADCAARALEAGIGADRIVLDPGIGFGKTLAHNLALLASLDRLCDLGFPVLVGVSRKSMLGTLTGRGLHDRLAAGLGAALAAVSNGAAIVRTHDVAETVDALAVASAIWRPQA